MDLKPVTRTARGNRYCGPAVISAITGITTCEASKLIRKQTGRRQVISTRGSELRAAYRALGVDMTRTPVGPSAGRKNAPTLAAWLRGTQDIRTAGRVFLVLAGSHWQLISGRRYVCGISKTVVSIKDDPVKRRARVAEVYELTETSDARTTRKRTMDALAADAAHTKRRESDRAYVKRLSAKHGITVEVDNWGGGSLSIYCFPPEWFQSLREQGQIEGFVGDSAEVVGYSWAEARDVIDAQIAAMENLKIAA